MKTAILPFLLLLATFLRITSSGSAEEGLDQVTQPISSSKNNNEIPEDSHDNRLQDNYGFVRRARMAKVDWIWEAVDGVRYEQGFLYDPFLTLPIDAMRSYCDRGRGDRGLQEVCSNPNVVKGIVDGAMDPWVLARGSRLLDVIKYTEDRIQAGMGGDGLKYLRHSDGVSAEFVVYPRMEIQSMLVLEACGGKAYLRHARPACTTPTEPFLKTIGTCPMSALEDGLSFDVVPANFTCPRDQAFTSGATANNQVWMRAGSSLVKKGQHEHGIAAFYVGLQTALRLGKEGVGNKDSIMEGLFNLGATYAAVNDLEGMVICYKAILFGEGGWKPHANLAALVKLVLYVPPILKGGQEEMDKFRKEWLEDAETLTQLLRQSALRKEGDDTVMIENDVWRSWGGKMAKVKDPIGQIGQTLFHLAHQGENDYEMMEAIDRVYGLIIEDEFGGEGQGYVPNARERGEGEKIRVGFVSTLMSDHSIGKMMVPVTRALSSSPHSDLFDVIVVGNKFPTFLPSLRKKYGPFEGDEFGLAASAAKHEDVVVRFTCQTVKETATLPLDLDAARELLQDLKLDVLIFPDIGMDAMTYFLARQRFAGVQLAWWGHPITTGLGTFDYYFGLDAEVEGAAMEQYSEQLVRMSWMNTAPFASSPDGPEKVDELSYFGIEKAEGCEDMNVYMVLGRLFKIHHEFENIMFRILEEDKCGVIVLISEKTTSWNTALFERMEENHEKQRKEGGGLGIDVKGRIRFVAYWNYVRIMAHAVAILDTYPYGGCLTTQEAMSNGKVVVTMPSKYVRGQFTKSIYMQMGDGGEEGWPIAKDEKEYVEIAVKVARDDGGYTKRVKERMRDAWENEGVHRTEKVGREWANTIRRAVEGLG